MSHAPRTIIEKIWDSHVVSQEEGAPAVPDNACGVSGNAEHYISRLLNLPRSASPVKPAQVRHARSLDAGDGQRHDAISSQRQCRSSTRS